MLGEGDIIQRKELRGGYKYEWWRRKIKQKRKHYSSVVLKGPVIFQRVHTREIKGKKPYSAYSLPSPGGQRNSPVPPRPVSCPCPTLLLVFFRTVDSNTAVRKGHCSYFGNVSHAKSKRESGLQDPLQNQIPLELRRIRADPSADHTGLCHSSCDDCGRKDALARLTNLSASFSSFAGRFSAFTYILLFRKFLKWNQGWGNVKIDGPR